MSRAVSGGSVLLWAMTMIFATGAHAAWRVDLDGAWRFRADRAAQGEMRGWPRQAPEATRPVDVPHSWNADGQGDDTDWEGVGWYWRHFDAPPRAPGRRIELHFDATFYSARVWVNGHDVGRHEGGHTAYWFDITQALNADGSDNTVAVAIDNRPSDHSLPGQALRLAGSGSVWYDWWHAGGIVRDVWLSVADGAEVCRVRLQSTLTVGRADVDAEVQVDHAVAGRALTVEVQADAPDGHVAASRRRQVLPDAAGPVSVQVPLTIVDPVLWNVGDGQLYQVTVTLRDAAGRVLDRHTDTLGLRRIELRDRRLWVNGRPVRLTGLTRHEDSPWEGLAETRGTVLHDWDDLRDLHTTLTRPVHYPQSRAVLDAADRRGILLVPEIPMWQFSEAQMRDPRTIALARQMVTEMIAEDGNHPSIFAWSVCNESDARTPGGDAYVTGMQALIHQLDPGRFVTYADADLGIAPWPDEAAAHAVDFVMANAYFGTWDGPAAQVEPWLDFMDRTYPEKMVIVSEFGYPGPFSADAAAADRARIENMHSQLDAFERRPFIGGAIYWTYQDYKSHRNLWPGQTAGYVDHGLVDEHRQRKPSYTVWQQRNAPLAVDTAWVSDARGLTGFRATLTPNAPSRLPSYPLARLTVAWAMVDRDGRHLADGSAAIPALDRPTDVTGQWPADPSLGGAALQLRVQDGAGAELLRSDTAYAPLRFGQASFPAASETSAASAAPTPSANNPVRGTPP